MTRAYLKAFHSLPVGTLSFPRFWDHLFFGSQFTSPTFLLCLLYWLLHLCPLGLYTTSCSLISAPWPISPHKYFENMANYFSNFLPSTSDWSPLVSYSVLFTICLLAGCLPACLPAFCVPFQRAYLSFRLLLLCILTCYYLCQPLFFLTTLLCFCFFFFKIPPWNSLIP